MKWMFRVVKVLSSGLLILVVAFLFMLNACSMFRPSDEKIMLKASKEKDVEVSIHRFSCGEQTIRYMVYEHAQTKQDSLAIVCLHGAPGMYSDYRHQFYNSDLLKKADFIVVERPGYGESGYGIPEPSIIKQAACIQQVLAHENRKAYVVTGYSYGGPVAAAMAATNDTNIKALVLVSPVIDPENEKFFWFSRLPQKAAFKWMLPKAFYVASVEKDTHVDALKEIEPLWNKIQIPTQLIHGTTDKIAPYSNAEYGIKHFPTAYFKLIPVEGGSHTLIWNKKEIVRTALEEALEQALMN